MLCIMKQCRLILALGILASLWFFLGAFYYRAYRPDRKELVVLTCSDSAPFSFHDGHTLAGFDIDLAWALGRKLGRPVSLRDLSFHTILDKITMFDQEADMAITAITSTSERQRFVDLSIPYHHSSMVLLTNSSFENKDKTNKIVAYRSASTHEAFAKKNIVPFHDLIQIYCFDTFSDSVLNALLENRIQAVILDYEEAAMQAAMYPALKIVPLEHSESPLCILFPKGSSLKSKINKALKELKEEGILDQLVKKWLTQESLERQAKLFGKPRSLEDLSACPWLGGLQPVVVHSEKKVQVSEKAEVQKVSSLRGAQETTSKSANGTPEEAASKAKEALAVSEAVRPVAHVKARG